MEQSFLVTLDEDIKEARKDLHDTVVKAALSDLSLDLEKFTELLDRNNALHNAINNFDAAMAEVWDQKTEAFQAAEETRQAHVDELKSYGGNNLERLVLSLAQHESTFTKPEEWAKMSKTTRTLNANSMDFLKQPMPSEDIDALERERNASQKALDECPRLEAESWVQHEEGLRNSLFKSLVKHKTLKGLRDQVVSAMSHEAVSETDLFGKFSAMESKREADA